VYGLDRSTEIEIGLGSLLQIHATEATAEGALGN